MRQRHTITEYVELDRVTERNGPKLEYVHGQILAMTGGSIAHARLITAVASQLEEQLGDRCTVYSAELRVRADELLVYPDVTVVCGEPELDAEAKNTITNPSLLVEVLSPNTEEYDRTEKLEAYRAIPGLCEYVLVSSTEKFVEVLHVKLNTWARATSGRIAIPSSKAVLDIERLYAKVKLP